MHHDELMERLMKFGGWNVQLLAHNCLYTQVCWYFGLEEALIQSNFSDPDFVDCLGRDRTYVAANTFTGSPEFRRLNELLGGQLTTEAPSGTGLLYSNSFISLGECTTMSCFLFVATLDHVLMQFSRSLRFHAQALTLARSSALLSAAQVSWLLGTSCCTAAFHAPCCHSCCLHLFHRYEDMDPKSRAKIMHHKVLMLIPPVKNANGTTSEPPKLDGYFLPVCHDLQRLGPQLSGHAEEDLGPLSLPRTEIGELCLTDV